jgi:hypothetical protein
MTAYGTGDCSKHAILSNRKKRGSHRLLQPIEAEQRGLVIQLGAEICLVGEVRQPLTMHPNRVAALYKTGCYI